MLEHGRRLTNGQGTLLGNLGTQDVGLAEET